MKVHMQTTINKTDIAEQEVRAGVNEKNFFSSMKHLFSTSFTVLGELMQNSRRAGATHVVFNVDVEKKVITISDDGDGIADFSKLIQLCESGWDEQVTLSEQPFGMGFFSVFYACNNVTIRSKGLLLQAGLDDISNKRALKAVKDLEPIIKGVVITLNGVCEKLLDTRISHYCHDAENANSELLKYDIYHQLRARAMGFPISVRLNGVEVPRPHAPSNLTGEYTNIGLIQIAHVHTADKMLPTAVNGFTTQIALYLQGLPIEGKNVKSATIIVHLDPAKFIAKMPDRSHLYDSDPQLKIVHRELNETIKRFLVTQKRLGGGEDFVTKYWDACFFYGVKDLLNDIPFVPERKLRFVDIMSENSDDRWTQWTDIAALVSRQQIMAGEVKVWRHVPEYLDDDKNALVLQKVMQRNQIGTIDGCGVHDGHWLNQCTPSCEDFVVTLEPINQRGQAHYDGGNYSCSIKLADSINVVITSEVDPQFRLEHSIMKDWVVEDVTKKNDYGDKEVVCYVTPDDASLDYPIKLFSSYTDDNDNYREDWEDDAIKEWNSLLAGMLGRSMTKVVEMGLGDMNATLSQNHDGQMTLLCTFSNWYEDLNAYSTPRLKAVDLEDTVFWKTMAKRLSRKPITADGLKAAFAAVANSGEKIGGPQAKAAKKK